MTGEPTHTASKERMAPELMVSSEHAPQLSQTASKVQWRFQLCSARYTAPQTKNSKRSPSATILSPRKYDDSRPTNYQLLPHKCSSYITLRFQLCSTRYKQRTVLESFLQSVQSPRKIRTIPVYKHTVGKPCITLPRINTFGCKQKEMGHKEGQR